MSQIIFPALSLISLKQKKLLTFDQNSKKICNVKSCICFSRYFRSNTKTSYLLFLKQTAKVNIHTTMTEANCMKFSSQTLGVHINKKQDGN